MAATRSNLVLFASVPSAVHETTAVDDGFGSTTNLTARKRNLWMYSSTDSLATVAGAGYFAVAGSTSGDSTLNEGDFIFVKSDTSAQLYYVSDAAAGSVTVLGS